MNIELGKNINPREIETKIQEFCFGKSIQKFDDIENRKRRKKKNIK